METWKVMNNIRENLSDKTIVDELVQYLSSDALADFCDHLKGAYDFL